MRGISAEEVEALARDLEEKEERFTEAATERKTYRFEINEPLARVEQFQSEAWCRTYPNWAAHDPNPVVMPTPEIYAELDRLNKTVAPLRARYRQLKAVENAAKTEFERAEREYIRNAKKPRILI